MNRLFVWLVALTIASLPLAAQATSVVLLDLDTHLTESTAVIEAVVGTAESTLDLDTNRPVTDTPLRVTGVLFGSAPSAVTVRQLKGKVGNIELHFPGAGVLKEGSRVVVFLVQAEGRWWLTALAQSVYEVQGEGSAALAVRQLDQLHLFLRDPDLGVLPLGDIDEQPMTVNALRNTIRATVEEL